MVVQDRSGSTNNTPSFRLGAVFGWLPFCAALLLTLSACSSSSSGEGDDPFSVAVSVAVNDQSASGSVNWQDITPDITSLGVVVPEDTTLRLALTTPPDTSTVSIQSFPEFGAAVLSNGVLEYTPNINFFGQDALRIVRDDIQYSLNITVMAVNDPPEIIGDVDRVAEQGLPYLSQIEVRNVDSDVLAFSGSNLPDWLSINTQTGLLSGTPEQNDVGLHENINLIVRDNGGLDDALVNVTIEVLDLNDAPTLNVSQFPPLLDARQTTAINVFPDDIDGDSVSLEVEPNDFVDATVNGGTINLQVTDLLEVTDINLVLNATDQLGNVTREVVPLTLHPLTDSGRGRTLQGKQRGVGLHLVVLGDGYRSDQIPEFRQDVESLIETMNADPAVGRHLSAWSIHMVETPSVDSGIDDNIAVDVRNTFFNSGYFCLSIARLVCGDNNIMFDVALDEYPDVDELVMLVNDPRYGGSGGSVAVASSSAPEIALHELGHSFAGLADEYVDSSIPALSTAAYEEGAFANVSRFSDPTLVPWSAWIDIENSIPSQPGEAGVGLFQGAYYDADAYFRPTFNSRMRSFDRPFGPVNGEAWALSVYRQTNPVASFSPIETDVFVTLGDLASFEVKPIFGPDVQEVIWTLDGRVLTQNVNDSQLNLLLAAGEHVLTVEVEDLTGAIRTPGPHAGEFLWRWDITVQ